MSIFENTCATGEGKNCKCIFRCYIAFVIEIKYLASYASFMT